MDNEIGILMGAVYAIDGMIRDDYEYFITRDSEGKPLKIKYTDIRDYLINRMVAIWRGEKK